MFRVPSIAVAFNERSKILNARSVALNARSTSDQFAFNFGTRVQTRVQEAFKDTERAFSSFERAFKTSPIFNIGELTIANYVKSIVLLRHLCTKNVLGEHMLLGLGEVEIV